MVLALCGMVGLSHKRGEWRHGDGVAGAAATEITAKHITQPRMIGHLTARGVSKLVRRLAMLRI
jgi:hypothetical protein